MRAGWYARKDRCAREEGGNGDGRSKKWPSYRKPVREVVWWLWAGTSSIAGLYGGNDVNNTDPDRFITSETSVPVLPNTSSSYSLSRPPLEPPISLPSSDCYRSTQTRTQCRVRNDVTIGGDWPEPMYQLNSHDLFLLDRKHYNAADHNRRKVLERGPGVVNYQLEECKGSSVTLPPSSVHDAENQHCRSISECSHPACDARSEHSRSANEIESQYSRCAGDAATEYSHSISHAGANYVPEMTPSTASFIRSLFSKLLPYLPCLQTNFHDDNGLASISLSHLIWSHPIFGARPPDTLSVIVVLDDLESIKVKQVNYPWDVFKEMRTTQMKYAS